MPSGACVGHGWSALAQLRGLDVFRASQFNVYRSIATRANLARREPISVRSEVQLLPGPLHERKARNSLSVAGFSLARWREVSAKETVSMDEALLT